MKTQLKLFLAAAMILAVPHLWADQVELLNGDRLSGKVLSVSASTVLFDSEMLGRVSVPRKNISALNMGAHAAPASPLPPAASTGASTNLNASLTGSGAGLDVISQIRQQMLGGNPAATAKFNELASGFMSGKLNLDDIRREARSAVNQIRELKRENPEVADSFNAYLQVLQSFLNEPAEKTRIQPPLHP